MTRRQQRENAFVAAFEQSFGYNTLDEIAQNATENATEGENYRLGSYSLQLLETYNDHVYDADKLIEPCLTGWTMARIPRVCLVIMRMAIVEMLYIEEVGTSVAINEAVELAKKYGSDDDYQFVNGVLGTIARTQGLGDSVPVDAAALDAEISEIDETPAVQPADEA